MAAAAVRGRVFSGIQSTGIPHVGNYLGALAQWCKLQDQRTALPPSETIFSVVDLHSITVPQKAEVLRQNTRDTLVALLACGLSPDRCVIFQQSAVPQHAELAWIFGCIASMGQLSRMTQWKTKARQQENDHACLGLFAYPVLQTADILLYRATQVPVGHDQLQHLELARDIATVFNKAHKTNVFRSPEPVFSPASRIKSLRAPDKKMSKSDPLPGSRINLSDTPDQIMQKIRKAITDANPVITYDPEFRAGVSNLVDLYAGFTDQTPEAAVADFAGLDTLQFKEKVASAIAAGVEPIQQEMVRLQAEPAFVDGVLARGAASARDMAEETMVLVRQAVGLAKH